MIEDINNTVAGVYTEYYEERIKILELIEYVSIHHPDELSWAQSILHVLDHKYNDFHMITTSYTDSIKRHNERVKDFIKFLAKKNPDILTTFTKHATLLKSE